MRSFYLLLLSIIGFFSCEDYSAYLATEECISQVQREFVKDKRTSLFNAAAKTNNSDTIYIEGETTIPQAKERLFELLDSNWVTYVDRITLLPSANLNGKHYGVVRISVANLRSNEGHSSELSTQALLGEQLRVWKESENREGWFLVQTANNYFGWLDAGGFTLMNEEEYKAWQNAPKTIISQTETVAFEKPEVSVEEGVVSDLVLGNILIDKGEASDNDQMKMVEFPDGRTAYVIKRALADYDTWLNEFGGTSESILATAKKLLGRPYLWGGTSPKGMDCSGFTKTVFFWNGIQLERDASLQVHTGIEIETDTTTWKNLLPGDLLFFGPEPGKIRHVAIWMGDGQIIHATELVKIESLVRGQENYAEARVQTFLKAKRILNSIGENGIIALKDSPYY